MRISDWSSDVCSSDLIFPETEVVELARRPEHCVDQLVELEIGFHLAFIEVIFRLADLLGIIAIVPRLDGDFLTLAGLRVGVGDRLHVGALLMQERKRTRMNSSH